MIGNETKQMVWNTAREKFSRPDVNLKKPVDVEVLDLVVGLNILDIPTEKSSEGRLGYNGNMNPFVQFFTRVLPEDVEGIVSRSPGVTKERAARMAQNKIIKQILDPLFFYLGNFYSPARGRNVLFQNTLVILTSDDEVLLVNQGLHLFRIEESSLLLEEFRREMGLFGDFLK